VAIASSLIDSAEDATPIAAPIPRTRNTLHVKVFQLDQS
jgi:hypothetical protein